jgi:hypothetical protein
MHDYKTFFKYWSTEFDILNITVTQPKKGRPYLSYPMHLRGCAFGLELNSV